MAKRSCPGITGWATAHPILTFLIALTAINGIVRLVRPSSSLSGLVGPKGSGVVVR